MTLNTTGIHHLIPVQNTLDENKFSFFQGFSHEVMERSHWMIKSLAIFPHDFGEIFYNEENYVRAKMYASPLDVGILSEQYIKDVVPVFNMGFVVLWSNEESYSCAVEASKLLDQKVIHITSVKNSEAIFVDDLNDDMVEALLIEVAESIIELSEKNNYTTHLKKLLDLGVKRNHEINSDLSPINHGCVQPNVFVLSSYNYIFEKITNASPSEEIDQHICGIVETSKEIDVIRNKSIIKGASNKNDAIIYCPSMYVFLYKQNSYTWNQIYRQYNRMQRNVIKQGLVRNKGYSNFSISGDFEKEMLVQDDDVWSFVSERQKELSYLTLLISVVAVNQFVPAIRLPNSVMLHHDKLKNIRELILSNKKDSLEKLNRKINLYQKELRNNLGDDLLDICFNGRKSLFCVCDFPIEWLQVDNMPIMFSHEVSRIPSTPGNLTAQLLMSGVSTVSDIDSLSKILIVRSFDKYDPIKSFLELGINTFAKGGGYANLKIEWRDVNSEAELVETLNSFDGKIVVFDCHGGHGGEKSHVWLQIGGKQVDVWGLSGNARIPPIVILSACDTHPIDGSHASVAAGFLRCGALSVLGTYAPIKSDHASVFVSRVLLRISEFLPVYLKMNRGPVSWRKVMSGFFRMSYATDILRGFRMNENIINEKQFIEIHNQSNMNINTDKENWFDELIKEVASCSSKKPEEVLDIVSERYSFVETMLYCHLGRPENLLIVDSH